MQRHQRLTSESSSATHTSGDAANDEIRNGRRRHEPSEDCRLLSAGTNYPANITKYQARYDINQDLQPQTSQAPYKELKQIFDKPREQLEERKKWLENETGISTRKLPGKSNMSTRTNEAITSSNQNVENNLDDAKSVRQNSDFSNVSKVCIDSNDDTSIQEVKSHKSTLSNFGCRCCFQLQNMHHKSKELKECEFHENHKPPPEPRLKTPEKETECHNCYARSRKSDSGEEDPNVNNRCNRCENKKETLEKRNNAYRVRDEIILDYQFQEMMCHKAIKQKLDEDYAEIQKLRKNYSSLKKLFSSLAALNVILILCIVSVMPVILVTFKMSNEGEYPSDEDVDRSTTRHLSSEDGKAVVKEHIFCVECEKLKEPWSHIFTRKAHKGCCLEDVASLVERLISFGEKNSDEREFRITEKVKRDNQRRDAAIGTLQNIVFNTSFNGSVEGPILGSQNEKNSKLINTLLTRKRSAVHLSGSGGHHHIEWNQKFPKRHLNSRGHLRLHNNMIKVENGGVYFVYSCIRFEAGICHTKQTIGYEIWLTRAKDEWKVASVLYSCVNGTNTERDLAMQQVVNIPVDKKQHSSSLHIKIHSNHDLVSKNHRHFFGLFEI